MSLPVTDELACAASEHTQPVRELAGLEEEQRTSASRRLLAGLRRKMPSTRRLQSVHEHYDRRCHRAHSLAEHGPADKVRGVSANEPCAAAVYRAGASATFRGATSCPQRAPGVFHGCGAQICT